MSQHTFQKFGLAVLLGVLLAPAPTVHAQSAGGPNAGDLTRPRIMQLAAGKAATAPARRAGGSITASPAPATSAPSVQRQVFGYVNAGNFTDPSVGYASWQWQLLTTVAYFGVHVNSDGSLSNSDLSGWSGNAATLVTTAHSHGVKAVLSIIQQSQSTLCSSLAAAQTTVTATINNLHGADGVNIDYEGSGATCSSNSGDTLASRLNNLARLFRQQLPAAQSNLTIATYAGAAEFPGGFFDIPGLAPYVDSFFVMAYDLDNSNYSHAPLNCSRYCFNPVGPAYGQPNDANGYWYNDTRAAATYKAALGSGAKVIMGVPYYGWTACAQGTVGNQGAGRPGPNAYPDSGSPQWSNPGYVDAQYDITQSAPWVTLLATGRDPADQGQNQEPFATWWSPPAPAGSSNAAYYHNCWREMYWDDATSLGKKYDVVNSYDLGGAGLFALDYGGGDSQLWSAIALHFTNLPAAPANVSACAGQTSATVSWSPAYSPKSPVTGYHVTAFSGGTVAATQDAPASSQLVTLGGLTAGTTYTFDVQAVDVYGAGPGGHSNAATPVAGAASSTSYFSWYDRASPGVTADNIHVVNRSGAASTAVGCALVPGVAVLPFSVGPGSEQVLAFPNGTLGGPVQLSVFSGPAVLASQRVQYYSSFNEIPALSASAAAGSVQFAWYDLISSPGFKGDYIHVFNPGGTSATGSVAIPGCAAQVLNVGAGQEQVFSCARGFGGPVTVSANQPVLASQRVLYYQSFNEEWGQAAGAAATQLQLNWYDRISSPGFQADNVHVWNPGASAASGTVAIPGCPPQPLSIGAGQEQVLTCGQGFGGPVTISADHPVLASQRVQYYQSFNEVPALGPGQAAAHLYFTWYDHASSYGFASDNIHVLNPSGALSPAQVTVTIPGCSPGAPYQPSASELVYSCPFGQGFGGPVLVTATVSVVASQRVQYYQSFNEVSAEP